STPSTDYFPGTQMTRSKLQDLFPIGWIVFSERDGRWTYEPAPSNVLHYEADWGAVKIIPDFATKSVSWDVPAFHAKSKNIQSVVDQVSETVPRTTTDI